MVGGNHRTGLRGSALNGSWPFKTRSLSPASGLWGSCGSDCQPLPSRQCTAGRSPTMLPGLAGAMQALKADYNSQRRVFA